MLQPKKLKHTKIHKGRRNRKGIANVNNKVAFGNIGLKSLEHGKVNSNQIESMRRVIIRHTQRAGKVWIRIYPHKPITGKGVEVKMGKGVGDIDRYCAVVKPGTVLIELDGVGENQAKKILQEAAFKLPVKTKIVLRD